MAGVGEAQGKKAGSGVFGLPDGLSCPIFVLLNLKHFKAQQLFRLIETVPDAHGLGVEVLAHVHADTVVRVQRGFLRREAAALSPGYQNPVELVAGTTLNQNVR